MRPRGHNRKREKRPHSLQELVRLFFMTSKELEQMLTACLPGGHCCDPQKVADDMREWLGKHGSELERENARLREALGKLATAESSGNWAQDLGCVKAIAHMALHA